MTPGLRYLNLPQVFFMDRGECVNTRLVWGNGGVIGVTLQVVDLNEANDSLSLFLEEMSRVDFSSPERSFLTFGLRNVSHEEFIPYKIYVYRDISIEELISTHPSWANQLRTATTRYKEKGHALIGIMISSRIDLASFNTLAELAKAPGFSIRTHPLNPVIHGE